VDIIYLPENEKLHAAIRNQGVVLSEMRLGEAPQARHFLRHNRIISGLARGADRLIREGATLTESADDILSVLFPIMGGAFGEPDSLSPLFPPMRWKRKQTVSGLGSKNRLVLHRCILMN
jgi:DNA processing protein